MVPDTPDVEKVLFGSGGVAEGLSKGKTVIDMSSISPIATKEYANKINSMSSEIYTYLNFDRMGEYTAQADKINVAQLT